MTPHHRAIRVIEDYKRDMEAQMVGRLIQAVADMRVPSLRYMRSFRTLHDLYNRRKVYP